MKAKLIAIVTLLTALNFIGLLPHSARAEDAVARCDALAASPSDLARPMSLPGVPFANLDVERAIPPCEAALLQQPDNMRIKYELARIFLKANRDLLRAAALFKEAADHGYGAAMQGTGVLYFTGQGYAQDFGAARTWFEMGAVNGSALAMCNLGMLYANGQGVAQDHAKARTWYEKGAASDEVACMRDLAALFQNATGIAQDYGKAREWLERCAALADADCMNNMGVLYDSGNGVPRDYAKAREWFEKAAAAGSGIAMRNVGGLYESGQGVAQDFSKAREWLERAAAAGDADARERLAAIRLKEISAIAAPVGTVHEVYAGTVKSAPIVIIGEDHQSRIDQHLIAIMLERLHRNAGMRHIGLEGMTKPSGHLEAGWFHSATSDVTARQDVAARMLGEGEISSAEMMALVHEDVRVFGVEDEKEYLAPQPTSETAKAYFIYLTTIALFSAPPDQQARIIKLMATDPDQAMSWLLESNPWIKQHRDGFREGDPMEASFEGNLQIIKEVEDKARETGAPIPSEIVRYFQTFKAATATYVQRSRTMTAKAVAVARTSSAPVALIIGAKHSKDIASYLKGQGISYVLVTPLSMGFKAGVITEEQFARKEQGLWARASSGTLGAILNQNHKEPPVIESQAARSYASMQLASIIIAKAARDGKKVPDDILVDLALLPGIAVDRQSFSRDGLDVIFSASLTAPNGRTRQVWARVGTVPNSASSGSLEETLWQDVADLSHVVVPRPGDRGGLIPPRDPPSTTSADDEGPGDYRKAWKAGAKIVVQRLNSEVVAAFVATKEAVNAVGQLSKGTPRIQDQYALLNGQRVEPERVNERLYYGTSLMTWEEIESKGGLPERGDNLDLLAHARGGQDSAFRGTTTLASTPDGKGAVAWADKGGLVIEIDGIKVPGYDLNKIMEGRVNNPAVGFGGTPWHGENEIAIHAKVPIGAITRYGVVDELPSGKLIVRWQVNSLYEK